MKENNSEDKILKSRSVSDPIINDDNNLIGPSKVQQKASEKQQKKNFDYSNSTTDNSSDLKTKLEKSKEYTEKKVEMMKSRLEMARCWVIVVCSYFLLRAALLLYP